MIVMPENSRRGDGLEPRPRWPRSDRYPPQTIGHRMEPALAVFRPEMTVADTVAQLRTLIKSAFITYGYVTDAAGRLVGIITMRDLLFAGDDGRLDALMLRKPFSLKPEAPLAEAMRQVLHRHYPVYPVCDDEGVLIGLVRGDAMFEEQAIEFTAQPGSMTPQPPPHLPHHRHRRRQHGHAARPGGAANSLTRISRRARSR